MSSDNSAKAEDVDLAEILRLSPVPTLVVSPSRRILKATAGFLEAWGVQPTECVGLPLIAALADLSPPVPGENGGKPRIETVIDEAIVSRSELTSDAISTRNDRSWSVRVIPIFRQTLTASAFSFKGCEAAERAGGALSI